MSDIQTEGTCLSCSSVLSKAAMSGHLRACLKKAGAGRKSAALAAGSFHISAEGRYAPFYWIHIEASGRCTLYDLDELLRQLWLECCGHMSAFTIEKREYVSSPDDDMGDPDMDIRLDRVLRPGLKLFHQYDFGSTTDVQLKVVSRFDTTGGGKSVRLLARNLAPAIPCDECSALAVQVCTYCGPEVWLCKACAPRHECGEDSYLRVVNSPRVATCGCTG